MKHGRLWFLLGVMAMVSGCGKLAEVSQEILGKIGTESISKTYSGTIYPVIFVHGINSSYGVEDTWKVIVQNLDGADGYHLYPNVVYANSSLPSDMSPKTLLTVGYYRDHPQQPFGEKIGYIGGLDPSYYDHSGGRFGPNEVTYVSRLSKIVDHVLAATGAQKVNLVCHSMGGLVGLAYIKWGGGADKVNKILTVGSPIHGTPKDLLADIFRDNTLQDWQHIREFDELTDPYGFKGGRSYTAWLNDGLVNFLSAHGVRIGTIRGFKNPMWVKFYPSGDGVVPEESALLDGAEFNFRYPGSHCEFPSLLAEHVSTEDRIDRSTYTMEVIRRWILQDEPMRNGQITSLTPLFGDHFAFSIDAMGTPINGYLKLFDFSGRLLGEFPFVLNSNSTSTYETVRVPQDISCFPCHYSVTLYGSDQVSFEGNIARDPTVQIPTIVTSRLISDLIVNTISVDNEVFSAGVPKKLTAEKSVTFQSSLIQNGSSVEVRAGDEVQINADFDIEWGGEVDVQMAL